MDLIAIIFFIIIILTVMIMSYIPFELQELAEKAEFGSFSLRYMILKIQKVPMKYLFEQFEKLADNDIEEDFDDLVNLWKSNPEEINSVVKILTEGSKSDTGITLDDIARYKISEKNYKRFVQILNILEEPSKKISEESLIKLINSNIDIQTYFKVINTSKQFGFKLSENQINPENLNDLLLLTENLKNLKDAGIELKGSLIEDKDIDYHTKAELLSIIPDLKKYGLTFENKDIKSLYESGTNFIELTDTLKLIIAENIKEISHEQVIQHYLKGGNGSRVVSSFLHAAKQNIILKPDTLFKLEIELGNDYNKLLKNCINTYEFEPDPPVKILLENGLQVSPQIIITARNTIHSLKKNDDQSVFVKLINGIVSGELNKYSSHSDILKNLKKISEKIETKSLKNEIIADHFESFSVKISDLIINKDVLEEIKKSEASDNEEKEKLKLLKAKRKSDEEIAKAVKEGKLSYTDYLKEKYIFNDDDKDLPYHTD